MSSKVKTDLKKLVRAVLANVGRVRAAVLAPLARTDGLHHTLHNLPSVDSNAGMHPKGVNVKKAVRTHIGMWGPDYAAKTCRDNPVNLLRRTPRPGYCPPRLRKQSNSTD